MTQPQNFFAPLTFRSDREIHLNVKESLIGATMFGVLLAGCSATGNTDVTGEMNGASSSAAMMEAASSSAVMQDSSSSVPAMMQQDEVMEPAPSESDNQAYNDGTFSADGVYRSPAGMEAVKVSLTLKDDVVTDAQFQSMATHPKSKMMQAAFGEGYKLMVVGKSIDELSLTVVNGSSLTPKGFMDAVAKIKVEAKES